MTTLDAPNNTPPPTPRQYDGVGGGAATKDAQALQAVTGRAGNVAASEAVAVAHRRGRRRGSWLLTYLLPLAARQCLQGFEPLLLKLRVESRQLFRRPVVEVFDHVGEFAREGVGAFDLSLAGPSFVEDDVAVKLRQVLAQTLLARYRAALLRGDDLLAQVVNLRGRVLQALAKRVVQRELRRALVEREPHAVDLVNGVGHVAQLVAQLEHEVELRLAVSRRVRRARVGDDLKLCGVNLLVIGHLHGVLTGQHARAEGRSERRARGGRDARRLKTHRPRRAAQAAPLAARNRAEQFSVGVEDFNLQVAEDVTAALVVSYHGLVGRVVAGELRVAGVPAAAAGDALHRGTPLNEENVFRESFGREHSQRRDVVNDPDAAPVRGNDEVVVARVYGEVAHGDVRHVAALVLRPLPTAVERDPQAELRADEEKVAVN